MNSTVERLSIEGPAGQIETVVEPAPPTASAPAEPSFGLVCHPHPLYGGTMDNKVVTTVAGALRSIGIPTVRFNFRGVGGSAGRFDQGSGEIDDAQAVAAFAARRWPGSRMVLAGFSFGGGVALQLAARCPPSRLITVAPAVSGFDLNLAPRCPWLIIQGDADDVVQPREVMCLAEKLVPKPTLAVLKGAGHFFHGRLQELRDAVIDAIRGG